MNESTSPQGEPGAMAVVGASTPAVDSAISSTSQELSPEVAAASSGHAGAGDHPTPVQRLLLLLQLEAGDLWIIAVYALALGVLSLATPIAVQAMVNQVAFGQLLQPLVALLLVLLVLLGLAGGLRILQNIAVEILQQRLLVRSGLGLARLLPRVPLPVLREHGPDLASRFLEIAAVQKAAAGLLLDGLAIALQLLIGMAVLAFYHPLLLAFDVVLSGFVALILLGLGRAAVPTSIAESQAKYAVADWLAALCRHPLAFKFADGPKVASARADALLCDYVHARRGHFRILLRQIIGSLTLQAVASVALLGIGGALVIAGQLTLGQLIAAELIVSALLAGIAKFGKHLEAYYDLLTALDKLGHLSDLEHERADGELLPEQLGGLQLQLSAVAAGYPGGDILISDINLQLPAGARVAIIGAPQSGKTLMGELLTGLVPPREGALTYDGCDLRDLQLSALRAQIALVCAEEPALFAGTVAEILCGAGERRSGPVSRTPGRGELRAALSAVGLWPARRAFKDGLDTALGDGAPSLSRDERWRLQLARVLVQRPRLVVIDKTTPSGGPQDDATAALLYSELPFTVVLCTAPGDPLLARCDEVYQIQDATLVAVARKGRK
jgi:ABC-type bacteriocin/lantibiotic exporter with double-glycine peptidase domain